MSLMAIDNEQISVLCSRYKQFLTQFELAWISTLTQSHCHFWTTWKHRQWNLHSVSNWDVPTWTGTQEFLFIITALYKLTGTCYCFITNINLYINFSLLLQSDTSQW